MGVYRRAKLLISTGPYTTDEQALEDLRFDTMITDIKQVIEKHYRVENVTRRFLDLPVIIADIAYDLVVDVPLEDVMAKKSSQKEDKVEPVKDPAGSKEQGHSQKAMDKAQKTSKVEQEKRGAGQKK